MTYIDRATYDFAGSFDRVADAVREYGIGVEFKELPGVDTGTFDGRNIYIDTEQDVTLEQRLFLLAHLFGHSVQWNVSDELRELGLRGSDLTKPFDDNLIARIRAYEQEGSEYGLTAFHDAGVNELDQWLADWVFADWQYLDEVYRNGEASGHYSKFFVEGAGPALVPKPIPEFTPREFETRQSF